MLNSKNVCLIFAAGFLAPGILGFISNPIVSPHGLFVVNTAHNLVHLLTGVAFLLGGLVFAAHSHRFLQIIGVIYVFVSIVGFLTPGEYLLGFIHINAADKWLHVGLAALLLVAGFGLSTKQMDQSITA